MTAQEQQPDYTSGIITDFAVKLRDMEEKQRLLKDRVLLIGQNLVESREEIEREISELKTSADSAKQDILKIKETLQRIIEELDTRARRAEVDILKKQAKMFQPLNLVTRDELNKIISNLK